MCDDWSIHHKSASERAALWRRCKLDPADGFAREQLMLAYGPLVHYVAGRLRSGLPTDVEEADLVDYGQIGLINAFERFDPDGEILFEADAVARVKGAISEELRALDWMPRSVRARAREATTVPELDALWASTDSADDHASLLDAVLGPEAGDSEAQSAAQALEDRLAHAMSALSKREKLVIALHYDENMTLRDIGPVVGMAGSQIAQLHAKALRQLERALRRDA